MDKQRDEQKLKQNIICLKQRSSNLFVYLGGLSEEAEISGIQYVLSPYKLDLVATPLFLKPGIPYSVKVYGVGDGERRGKCRI